MTRGVVPSRVFTSPGGGRSSPCDDRVTEDRACLAFGWVCRVTSWQAPNKNLCVCVCVMCVANHECTQEKTLGSGAHVYSASKGASLHDAPQKHLLWESAGLQADNTRNVDTSRLQGSKVPLPNRRLVPGSREKRGETEKNGGKRGKTGENGGETGGKQGENGGKRGKSGGGFWTRPTHPTFDPPRPPPPFVILWGAFFANQIEAKALFRVRHPSPKG